MEEFFNRVRKNHKLRAKWAVSAQVESFRVYDRDIPQCPFVVDRYGEWAVVGSFARDPDLFEQLKSPANREALASALQVDGSQVVLRQRLRKRGDEQYEKLSGEALSAVVREHELSFELNLAQYLDVGLFLDHRPLRRFLQGAAGGSEEAQDGRWVCGKSCLNLFSYTGTVSAAMLKGGARAVVSVDMSHTYLDWYLRNLELNGLPGQKREGLLGTTGEKRQQEPVGGSVGLAVRADVTAWLKQLEAEDRTRRPLYDFIFVDPPSFSNSKKMSGTFDVQRDHPWLLRQCAKLLTSEGVLLFSNNRDGFKLESAVLSDHRSFDLGEMSHGMDFSQRKAHSAYAFSRSSAALEGFLDGFRRMAPARSR